MDSQPCSGLAQVETCQQGMTRYRFMTSSQPRRTLTGKFVALLACFLLLQIAQLGLGVVAVLHLGDETGLVNEAGKQRMRTYSLANHLHAAVDNDAWSDEGRRSFDRVMADYDAFFARASFTSLSDFLHQKFTVYLKQAQKAWSEEMKPLLLEVRHSSHPKQAVSALHRYELMVPAQVQRFDALVEDIVDDIRVDARYLAMFQLVTLALSLVLGLIGLYMARVIVTLPMRSLIDAAQAIASGAYHKRVPVSSRDEIGQLAATFNDMTAAVAEKTARITALNQVAVVITASLSKEEVLERILRHGMSLSKANAACVALYSQSGGRFSEWKTMGLSDNFVKNIEFKSGGLADETFSSGNLIVSNDLPDSRHKLSQLARDEGIRSLICLPLISHTNPLGVIYFYWNDRETFLPDEIDTLTTFAHLAAGAIENSRLYAWMSEQAARDMLTNLFNRRTFEQRLNDETLRATRYGKPFSLLMLDIDRFKDINDTHGHPVGDTVLRILAGILRNEVRDIDTVARYGGEEFVIILPETEGMEAGLLAERIRMEVAERSFRIREGLEVPVTISVGVACFPRCADSAQLLVERADQALYVAKQSGRNRVQYYAQMLKMEIDNNPGRVAELLNQHVRNVRPVVMAVDARSRFFRNHSENVARLCDRLARALDLDKDRRERLHYAAMLQNTGLISVPEDVLAKPAELTPDEWRMMRKHPAIGSGILDEVPELAPVASIVLHHHEHYDGSGYPAGLRGEAIPYLARVLTVADTYNALINERPYRNALSQGDAIKLLRADAGKRLDPEIVRVFCDMLEAESVA
jgi:diguanylate cyclase (GGDEF)-like protein